MRASALGPTVCLCILLASGFTYLANKRTCWASFLSLIIKFEPFLALVIGEESSRAHQYDLPGAMRGPR